MQEQQRDANETLDFQVKKGLLKVCRTCKVKYNPRATKMCPLCKFTKLNHPVLRKG